MSLHPALHTNEPVWSIIKITLGCALQGTRGLSTDGRIQPSQTHQIGEKLILSTNQGGRIIWVGSGTSTRRSRYKRPTQTSSLSWADTTTSSKCGHSSSF